MQYYQVKISSTGGHPFISHTSAISSIRFALRYIRRLHFSEVKVSNTTPNCSFVSFDISFLNISIGIPCRLVNPALSPTPREDHATPGSALSPEENTSSRITSYYPCQRTVSRGP